MMNQKTTSVAWVAKTAMESMCAIYVILIQGAAAKRRGVGKRLGSRLQRQVDAGMTLTAHSLTHPPADDLPEKVSNVHFPS